MNFGGHNLNHTTTENNSLKTMEVEKAGRYKGSGSLEEGTRLG